MTRFLRMAGLTLTTLFVVLGLLFALGYAWEDPGGWAATLMTLAIVVPLAGLVFLAARAPRLAVTVLGAAVGLYAAWMVLTLFVDVGEVPHLPVIALVLGLPIAVVGRRYALRAGALLLALAVVPFVEVLVRMFRESGPEGPGLRDLLGGSTGVVGVPFAFLALLFLIAGVGRNEPAAPDTPQGVPPARNPQPH